MTDENKEFDLLAELNEIDLNTKSSEESRESFRKAPFGWPGGKMRSLGKILPNLPYRAGYIEPFGGSGVVMLNRSPSKLETLNDRFAGVTDFYRVLKDPEKLPKLLEWLELTVHSREEFILSRDTWKDIEDPVERAARWYYSIMFSFGGLGRNFGRATKKIATLSTKLRERLPQFEWVHDRLKGVQIENLDWRHMLKDYDHPSHVFYLDPPYINAYRGTYKHEMTNEEHKELIARVFEMKSFVAISGYANEVYDRQNWDGRKTWEVDVTIQPLGANHETNNKHENAAGHQERGTATEVLWIKEAQ